MSGIIIRTSSNGWLAQVASACKARMAVTLVDDMPLGIDPINETLLQMGRRANTGHKPPNVKVSPSGGFEIRFD